MSVLLELSPRARAQGNRAVHNSPHPQPLLTSLSTLVLIPALLGLSLAGAAASFRQTDGRSAPSEVRHAVPQQKPSCGESGDRPGLRQQAVRRRLDQDQLLQQQLQELKQQLQEQLQEQKQKQQLQQQEQLMQQQQQQPEEQHHYHHHQQPKQQDLQQKQRQIGPTTPESPPPPPPPARAGDIIIASTMSCQPEIFMQLSYQGCECHVSNIWPGGLCPIDGACLPACSRCLHWRRGRIFLDRDTAPSGNGSTTAVGWHLANSPNGSLPERHGQAGLLWCDSTIWGFGVWIGESWVPSPTYPQCGDGSLLSPGAIYQCLRGRRVTFFGDSMIRPLMGRLIAYLRGIPQYVDHLYHHPGGYYMTNGTHDVFVEGSFLPSLHAALKAVHPGHEAPATPEDGWDPRVTLEMQLFWAPHFAKYELDGRSYPPLSQHLLALGGSDVMIAGPMYHDFSLYDSFREELLLYFRHLAHRGKRVKLFFWVATIPHETRHIQRNYLMRAFVEALNQRALSGDAAVPHMSYYVDVERMAQISPAKPVDLHLYQCIKENIFPLPLTNDLKGIAADKDCRDIFNLNVMQSILKVTCMSG